MSRTVAEPYVARMADGMDVPRPQLAGVLARCLSRTTVSEHVVALAATELAADVVLCEQVARLSPPQRVALHRAESQAIDTVGHGLPADAAHLVTADSGAAVTVVHGDGWSLIARSGPTLLILLDAAPCLVIDRSYADGAAELVDGCSPRTPTGS